MGHEHGMTIWLTGLSGAGKSTIARGLSEALRGRGRRVEVLDGDEMREHLSKGLGFSKEDRDTNIRRIAYVADLLTRNGVAVIAAAISPYRAIRQEAREKIGAFVEVFVQCPLDELVKRDAKGLYARALRGEIANFTGVSDPYEEPLTPEVVVHTDRERAEECIAKIIAHLEAAGYLPPGDGQIAPHGGRLVNRVASGDGAAALRDRIPALPRVTLGPRALSDLDMIASGAFSPLTGFMGRGDYARVVDDMHLTNGLPWSLPITLAATPDEAGRVEEGEQAALVAADGRVVGVLDVQDIFTRDVRHEARAVYRTDDAAHPGVAAILREGDTLVGGPVTVLERTPVAGFERYALDPAATRREFAARGWRAVVGFQTRNPVHRAHEYITKVALEGADGLLLHPLVGETKGDDIPADVRLRCYEALLEGYYPKDRVLLSVLPAAMRYAGPREAVFHALVRRNYGCTHFIVGRDHAGVGGYYGTYDAQRIFAEFAPGELGIAPLFFENAFYSQRVGGMATEKTAPPAEADTRVGLSGTKVREMLRAGELPPPEFTRPEVAQILADAMRAPVAASGE